MVAVGNVPVNSGHVTEVNAVSVRHCNAQKSPVADPLSVTYVAPACPKDCLSILLVIELNDVGYVDLVAYWLENRFRLHGPSGGVEFFFEELAGDRPVVLGAFEVSVILSQHT